MVVLNKVSSSIPVGREKLRSPLGHSGQRRLQLVVGSKEIETGNPHCIGLSNSLLKKKLVTTFNPFHARAGVSFPAKFTASLKLKSGIQTKVLSYGEMMRQAYQGFIFFTLKLL